MQKELPSLAFQNTGLIQLKEEGVRQQGGQPAIDTEGKASVVGRILIPTDTPCLIPSSRMWTGPGT